MTREPRLGIPDPVVRMVEKSVHPDMVRLVSILWEFISFAKHVDRLLIERLTKSLVLKPF